nr:MAG TPA: hypothetical protein [Caudoviricetes sp.]
METTYILMDMVLMCSELLVKTRENKIINRE